MQKIPVFWDFEFLQFLAKCINSHGLDAFQFSNKYNCFDFEKLPNENVVFVERVHDYQIFLCILVCINFCLAYMDKKLPWYITFNWKSILGTIAVLGLIAGLAVIMLLPKIVRNWKLENYQGETTAKILSVKENITTRQGSEGNKVMVANYFVKFQYAVNGNQYMKENSLDGTHKNAYYLNKVAKSNYEMPVTIRYDLENPLKALIIFEE